MNATCLQMDVGNSSAKWRLCHDGEVLQRGRYVATDEESARALLTLDPAPRAIWISSVASPKAEQPMAAVLRDCYGVEPWFARTTAEAGGLRNSYREPQRMGVDRWLAMLAGRQRAGGRVCVVDAGSALTIDLVDADGAHEGGYIIPGPALMERALLLDTDRVRFDEDVGYALDPGRSTAEAVRHGIACAQVGALLSVLQRHCAEDTPALYFCGGGGEALMELANCGGELVPDLVFEGLERLAALHGHDAGQPRQ